MHDIEPRAPLFDAARIDHLMEGELRASDRLVLHHGDTTDGSSPTHVLRKTRPDEVYDLAAQSHAAVSFEEPGHTADPDAMDTLRPPEAIRFLGLGERTRSCRAPTSEFCGPVRKTPQRETTPSCPRSPPRWPGLYDCRITVNHGETHAMYACNGILFDHESPRRGGRS